MNQHPYTFKSNQKRRTKFILIFLWGIFLSINTWTMSLEKLLSFQKIGFKWVSSPNFKSFFYLTDLALIHQDFIIIKLGHYIGFAIMDLLLFNMLKSHKQAIGISFAFAFFTEFFQLFLGRDGRLYDLGIDSLGILTVYLLLKYLQVAKIR